MERWRQEWSETDAGLDWFRGRRTYNIKVQPNGSFVLPEVLPGKYRLIVNVQEGSLGSGPASEPGHSSRQIAWFGQKVEVPDSSAASAVELGDLVLTGTP